MSDLQKKARSSCERLLNYSKSLGLETQKDRAAWLAAALTVANRKKILGPVPLFGIYGEPRSGKTLVCYTVRYLSQDNRYERLAIPASEKKARSALKQVLEKSIPIVMLEGVGKSGPLTDFLRSYRVEIASLGQLTNFYTNETVFLKTALSPSEPSTELERFTVPIQCVKLDKEPNHLELFQDDVHRESLIIAAWLVFNAHQEHKKCDRRFENVDLFREYERPKNTFEEWDQTVRSAVMWCGLPDPAAGMVPR